MPGSDWDQFIQRQIQRMSRDQDLKRELMRLHDETMGRLTEQSTQNSGTSGPLFDEQVFKQTCDYLQNLAREEGISHQRKRGA